MLLEHQDPHVRRTPANPEGSSEPLVGVRGRHAGGDHCHIGDFGLNRFLEDGITDGTKRCEPVSVSNWTIPSRRMLELRRSPLGQFGIATVTTRLLLGL